MWLLLFISHTHRIIVPLLCDVLVHRVCCCVFVPFDRLFLCGPVAPRPVRVSPASSLLLSSSTGLVPEQENQMAEEARGGDGHGQEEARLWDGEDEGELGQRGGRRVQQTAGPQLGRRENHETVEKAQGHQPGADQPVQQQLGHFVMPTAGWGGKRGGGGGGATESNRDSTHSFGPPFHLTAANMRLRGDAQFEKSKCAPWRMEDAFGCIRTHLNTHTHTRTHAHTQTHAHGMHGDVTPGRAADSCRWERTHTSDWVWQFNAYERSFNNRCKCKIQQSGSVLASVALVVTNTAD